MKNSTSTLSALALILLSATVAFADNAGTTGAPVLNIGVGARAIAMGEAYTAAADDSSSLYWNPAGIALLNQSQASFMYSQWLKDLNYHHAAVATPLEYGGIGASLSYLSYGKIAGFDATGNPTGDVAAYSGVATVGGAFMGDYWSAGLNLKGIQGKLADVKATGFATDLGMNAYFPREVLGGTLRAAAVYRNLGVGLKYLERRDPLPQQWRVGIAALEMARRKLNLSMDYGQEKGLKGAFYGGAEYWALPLIALRGGYAGSGTEGNGLRAGIGLKYKDVSFDYAFSSFGDLGLSHRYELTVRFGAIRPLLTPEQRALLRRGRIAMAQGRYGEATMIFNGLIETQPNYKPFRRLIKLAMAGVEQQDKEANKKYSVNLVEALKTNKAVDTNPTEAAELEALLNMSEPSWNKASVKAGAEKKGNLR